MTSWHNSTGRPLADGAWLAAHHLAKLPERTAFARSIAEMKPNRIVDLGCATGLWLDLLNGLVHDDCEFVGIDSDQTALEMASTAARKWNRPTRFLHLDVEASVTELPSADVTLAFNMFPYVRDLPAFLQALASRAPRGRLAVRQYDGAAIRFGPMDTEARQNLEVGLRVSLDSSSGFSHYDMDRTLTAIGQSEFTVETLTFETFQRHSPFPEEFERYYSGTLEWTRDLLPDASRADLELWMAADDTPGRYFYEVDLVAVLS